ncbi:MAG: hypothetical protein IT429_25670 [Gemmataceae bacterium]|nr:hypothetical protein [Gemmataceae bacterium]
MGEIVSQILTHGGRDAAVVAVFALANIGSLYLVLRWADRKQRRLVRTFRGQNARLIGAFTDAQAKHDRRLDALGERFDAVEDVVGELAEEVRRQQRPASPWAHVPEQRTP